jgi:hypothetical protein
MKSRLADHGLHTSEVVDLRNNAQKTSEAVMLPL